MTRPKPASILYVCTYPPRECGIATFTQDLTNAIDKEFNPQIKSKILAINDNGTSLYNYPRKVVMQINETEMEDYLNRANEINRMPEIKLVNIQHEFGLFGGEQGEYLLPFLELLKKPIIITMHTVLPNPGEKMKKIAGIIADKVEGITVMNKTAKEVLSEVYGIKKNKIHVIPHGVHHIPFPSKSRAKRKLLLSGHIVLSTFGMISRDKGIEYAIEALPPVVAEHPNLLYLVIGATHPVVRRQEGERYRNRLQKLVKKHKLEDNVKFYNKYLELSELIDYLKATDVYVYPMLSREQASSGSLSYAISCACPSIATASQYAESVINNERGRLVKFKSSKDITEALLELLPDKKLRNDMKKNAYFFSRHMTWQNVALAYFNLFNEHAKIVPKQKDKLPPIKLNHINSLSDGFALLQFARHTKPDSYSGYNLDDNARALLAFIKVYKARHNQAVYGSIEKYFKFVKFCQKSNGRFYNFTSPNKTFIDRTESDDSFGRAVWALGYLISSDHIPEHLRKQARAMLKKAYPRIPYLKSLRAISFTILGLSYIHENNEESNHLATIKRLSEKLIRRYNKTTEQIKDWSWFEDCLTYSNYKLPEALFRAYQITKNKEYLIIAENSLKFLTDITYEKNFFSPIGQDGWYFSNGKRAYFDQQPEDTAGAVEAYAAAFMATGKKAYQNLAYHTFEWFLGKNHLNQMVYDEATGGCYDGIGQYSLNFNQGAESTVSYLLARLAIEEIYK